MVQSGLAHKGAVGGVHMEGEVREPEWSQAGDEPPHGAVEQRFQPATRSSVVVNTNTRCAHMQMST